LTFGFEKNPKFVTLITFVLDAIIDFCFRENPYGWLKHKTLKIEKFEKKNL
jgi:hypothetical protein